MFSEYSYRRFQTREVRVGNIGIGGDNPVRIQSMVNTAPEDTEGTLAQIIQLTNVGCELVRLTVPSVKDAHNTEKIRASLEKSGCYVPLVADVHFNPLIAEICAQFVHKVRINPGNYGIYSSGSSGGVMMYDKELAIAEDHLERLIGVCRKHGTALRIGSNHGSLSPRILQRFGDTPAGMVEAALELVRICHRNRFHELLISMKSSNVRVMVQAYRLLVARMVEEGFDYPLHLGVTEAGFGTEGRIKSASGIGLLLDEGIGDTIRISLTEDPVAEIPVARKLLERYARFDRLPELHSPYPLPYDPFSYRRRVSCSIGDIGGSKFPVVIGYPSEEKDSQPDISVCREESGNIRQPDARPVIHWMADNLSLPLLMPDDLQIPDLHTGAPNVLCLPELPVASLAQQIHKAGKTVLLLDAELLTHSGILRAWMALLTFYGVELPVVLRIKAGTTDEETLILNAAITASALFTDGLADGLWIDGEQQASFLNSLAFKILQATRARISAPEYISCPSCGRTKFDIRETVLRIKSKTSHLKGLKIGIMGCIVNGPGEMADADYGYVGAGRGTITLYKGRQVVKKGVREEDAVDALIMLIKENGDWIEPR